MLRTQLYADPTNLLPP